MALPFRAALYSCEHKRAAHFVLAHDDEDSSPWHRTARPSPKRPPKPPGLHRHGPSKVQAPYSHLGTVAPDVLVFLLMGRSIAFYQM
jgi:hypothetical protein